MRYFLRLVLLSLLACGCTRTAVGEQVRALGSLEFTSEKWAVAAPVEREQMLASFFAQYPLERLTNQAVKKRLGEPTGYFDYDENLAYYIGPPTVQNMYGKERMLVFITDKRTGDVKEVEFVPPLP
jgi:hypothetical protein